MEQAKVGLQHTVAELRARLTEREEELEAYRQARRHIVIFLEVFFPGERAGANHKLTHTTLLSLNC